MQNSPKRPNVLRLLCVLIAMLSSILAGQASSQDTAHDTTQDEDDIRNWTPRAEGGPAWRSVDEEAWRDDRIERMDFGPCLGATVTIRDAAGNELVRAHKGIAFRLGGSEGQPQAVLVYDRNLLQCQGGWVGGDLTHDDMRYGLLDQPANPVPPTWHAPASLAWSDGPDQFVADRPTPFFPIDPAQGSYRSLSMYGDRCVLSYQVHGVSVLESPVLEGQGDTWAISRHLEVEARDQDLWLRIVPEDQAATAALIGEGVELVRRDGWLVAHIPAGDRLYFKLVHAANAPESFRAQPDELSELRFEGSPIRFGEVLRTRVEHAGSAGPYVQERLVPPFENPWGALMALSGIDFLPDGRAAVATVYGDVWLVGDLDSDAPSWTRYATGMYQPLGLRVVDGKIVVIERGQLTVLEDRNGDDQADVYHCLNNRWHTTGQPHAFDLCLEVDGDGNFYFFKTGAWHTPTGGCLLKIAADGSGDPAIFATGFRHANGMGISPDGQLSGAGQQGNWIPATRLDRYQDGGFYGMMNTHHRDPAPKSYHRPMMWFPLGADPSGASQVWTPNDWGPMGGQMLHLSWGQCHILRILPEEVAGWKQAAADVLPLPRTMAGPARASFSPTDGHLYIAGLKGWQTWGEWDGTLERIRYIADSEADQQLASVSDWQSLPDGLILRFDTPLDREKASNPEAWQISQWNYYWSHEYGSLRWRPDAPHEQGETSLTASAVHVSEDGREVTLTLSGLVPAMQTQIDFDLAQADGTPYVDTMFLTLHTLPVAEELAVGEDWLADDTAWNAWGGSEASLAEGALELQRMTDAGGFLSMSSYQHVQIDFAWAGSLGEGAVLVLREVNSKCYQVALSGNDAGGLRDNWRDAAHVTDTGETHMKDEGANRMRVRLEGRRIRIWVNGQQTADYTESDTRMPAIGRLGLAWPEGEASELHLTYFQVTPLRPSQSVDEPANRE